jgi:hypothetical protein
MHKITTALFFCALCASFAAAQFSAIGDSVYTTPARPTPKDSITYNFYDADACCCAVFVDPSVSIVDTMVRLTFSVNTAQCDLCRCILPGARQAFKGGPLKAGKYGIYRAQSFYCPPGSLCPAIVILPVRIGEMVVSSSTTDVLWQAPPSMRTGGLMLSQERNTIHIGYELSQPGHMRVRIFNAQGIMVKDLRDGESPAGMQRFSWTAPSQGVYFVRVEVNGTIAASREVIVSR